MLPVCAFVCVCVWFLLRFLLPLPLLVTWTGGGDAAKEDSGNGERECGFKTAAKLGQVPRLRCSEAVLEGLEAEKTASHKEHLSLTAFGRLVSGCLMRIGSKCTQYQAPLPLMALVRTIIRPSYRLFTAFDARSSVVTVAAVAGDDDTSVCGGSSGDGVVFAEAIFEYLRLES